MKEGERFWVWREAIGGIQQVQTDGVRGDGRADPAGSGEMAGPGDAMGHRTDVAGQTESADREADRVHEILRGFCEVEAEDDADEVRGSWGRDRMVAENKSGV